MSAIYESEIRLHGELTGVLIHPDGSHADLGILGDDELSLPKWRELYRYLRRGRHIPIGMGFAAFLVLALSNEPMGAFVVGVITSAGVNYMASDFLAASTAHIQTFNYHDSGTGTTAAAIGNTALTTPSGLARVAGAQSNPTANQYRTIATITYDASYAITEWGLFSAAAAGSLWDRKKFAAKSVVSTGIIAYTYLLSIYAGG